MIQFLVKKRLNQNQYKNDLVIPVLFIANIIPTLFDIFFAIKMKFSNMILVLFFEYLVVYIFMWITYFYMPNLFVFEDVMEPSSKTYIE